MKLVRFGEAGAERPGILDPAGKLRDASGLAADWNGAALQPQALARIAAADPAALPAVAGQPRLGPCIGRPGKIICIGLNYADHAAETGSPVPAEPIVFMKATTSFSGPFDPVCIPRGSETTDWEVELGVVIGSHARRISPADAPGYVAGYCVVNDISERTDQVRRGGQWVKGKSHDTFCPTGPWLVSADAIANPQDLRIWLEVDGRMRQDSSTANMIFPAMQLVSYLSDFMTLEPGDLIATGTPPGVGYGLPAAGIPGAGNADAPRNRRPRAAAAGDGRRGPGRNCPPAAMKIGRCRGEQAGAGSKNPYFLG